ncbi:hypothetical protein [Geodermatophilus obscurus]|uniref:DUF3040 domain-containing protein n=1 Tax=Geodermatophilus obscurus (strain ATCC 25078 / DSM 43160 / JCM 3152 / CCUG 61914 / KCC A-0152 / KCTC 9177 / NBRC 13315 / NRRL B-3577 / G-20) TaxID=526225 RepID=D2S7N4_GEOOG|nr:hypothetical protein [Geodermatophilus obscurus]ADB75493.1 hypothetical protein Gobs_2866 [Geodermatophilus obscurus DSM 43160]
MLSPDEQRAWDEIRRRCAEEVQEPTRPVLDPRARRPRSAAPAGLLATVVAGGCLAVLLVVCGAPLAGLAIAVATAPRWLLWRYWPLLDGVLPPSAPTASRGVPPDGAGHPSSGSCRRAPRTV